MGQNQKFRKKCKIDFFENVPDFIFGIYSVILCMGLGLSRDIKRSMVSVFILKILEHFQRYLFLAFKKELFDLS